MSGSSSWGTSVGDWRDVVDSVRAYANELWAGFAPEDQDRFVQQLARRWQIRRHRMSPDMAGHIELLRAHAPGRSGRGGRRLAVRPVRPGHQLHRPSPVPTPGWSRLVDSLLVRGDIRPHRLVAAIPDLRARAAKLAAHLLGGQAARVPDETASA